MYPAAPLPVKGSATINLGFYAIDVKDGALVNSYINWMSILFSVLTILYVIGACLFYWVYWNKGWSKYIKNAQICAFLILSGFLAVCGVVLGFINAPSIDFSKVNFNNGFDISSLTEGTFEYNFIYYCHFVKSGDAITYYWYYLTEYGILSIVVVVCLMLSLVANIIFIRVKRN